MAKILKLNKSGFKYRDPIEKLELIYNALKRSEYMTSNDLARHIGCCIQTIYTHTNWMVSKGFIVMIKLGRYKIFRKAKKNVRIREELEKVLKNER